MKLGVSLYSFHGYLNENNLGVKGCIDKSVEMGFEGIDIVEQITFSNHTEHINYATEIGEYCKKVGIEAVSYNIGSDFLNCKNLKDEIQRVKDKVDVAAAYGCSMMRHDATPGYPASVKHGRSFNHVLPILVEAYREVTEYAETKGVKTSVENHGFFIQDPERIEKLVDSVNHPNFGALVDIGNFSCADVDNAYAVGITAPYAIHVHAKDFHIKDGNFGNPGDGFFMTRAGNFLRGSIIGHGDVPIKACIQALRRAGYDGYMVIEFEGMEDPLKGISVGFKNLKNLMS